jgi:hypothetical protein
MRPILTSGVISYNVASTNEMILAAKNLYHDVYLQRGYIKKPFHDRIIPFERDASSVYVVALNSADQVVGTIRFTIGSPFATLNVWKCNLYSSCENLINDALAGSSFEIGGLAVRKEYSTHKISWGLYKAVYHEALALNLGYGIISMDYRALRSMEMLGWHVVRIGEAMNYFGSLTVPGIMPVKLQSFWVSSKNKRYHQYLAA